jgi:hypothetical protein
VIFDVVRSAEIILGGSEGLCQTSLVLYTLICSKTSRSDIGPTETVEEVKAIYK